MKNLTIYPSPNIYMALRGAGYNSSYAAIMKCIGVGLNSDDFGITNENELAMAESAV